MSGRIPSQTIDEVSRRIDVISVLGRYMQLRRLGSKYTALCPFHNEKTPSLSIDPEKGLWYCFGCKEGGSVFQFLMKAEGLSFQESVCMMAEEVGVSIDVSEEANELDAVRLRALSMLERSAAFYEDTLLSQMSGQPGREYLVKRNISKPIAEQFRLGWAPESGNSLLRVLHEAGFTEDEAVECGLAHRGANGVRDLLRGRLVFPICDSQGKVVAFGGRAMGEAQPKYLNTPETQWYSKRHHLYGLNIARRAIANGDKAVLTEGYFDVVSLHQAGMTCAVASLGTSLTTEQVALLHRYTRTVVIAYDGDNAGQMAAIKGSKILEEAGLRVLAAQLPSGIDPDNLALQGPEAVQEVISGAVGIVKFQMDRLLTVIDTSTPEGKEDFVRELLPDIERIRDSARQDAYVRRLAYYTGISEERLHWRLGRRRPLRQTGSPEHHTLDVEERLLCLCASVPAWIPVARAIISADLVAEELRPFFCVLFEMNDRNEPVAYGELVSSSEDTEACSRLARIMAEEPLQSTAEDVRKLAEAIRDRALRERLDMLREKVLPALDAGELALDDPLCKEYYQLRRHFHSR